MMRVSNDNYEDYEIETDIPVQTTVFAQKLAKSLIKRSKIKNPPILLNTIWPNLDFPIKVIGEDLGEDDGFCVKDKVIGYNNQKHKNRNRFTISHELGHILLGHNSGETPSKINFSSKIDVEKNANAFAAELLIPISMLKKEFLEKMSLSQLATKYEVSNDMMLWRLRETNLCLRINSLD